MRGVTTVIANARLRTLISTHTPHARRDVGTEPTSKGKGLDFNSHASCEA